MAGLLRAAFNLNFGNSVGRAGIARLLTHGAQFLVPKLNDLHLNNIGSSQKDNFIFRKIVFKYEPEYDKSDSEKSSPELNR